MLLLPWNRNLKRIEGRKLKLKIYKPIFPFEIEKKGYKELQKYIKGRREPSEYNKLKRETESILWEAIQNKIELINPRVRILSQDPKIHSLVDDTFTKIIREDPILFRVIMHNWTSSEDIHSRKWLRKYIPEELLHPYYDLLKEDFLKEKKVAGSSGIPIFSFLAGQIYENLLWEYEHFRCIDMVKETGIKDSIAHLRENRIIKSNDGIIWDYSPLIKRQIINRGPNRGILVEVFSEEAFKAARKDYKSFSLLVDNFLCSIIKQSEDCRHYLFLGRDFDAEPLMSYTIRYKDQKASISLQLLPKWRPAINKLARQWRLTTLRSLITKRGRLKYIEGEDEKQEAKLGFFVGLNSWEPQKGSAGIWLANNIKWSLSNAFKRLSTESYVEKRLEFDRLIWSEFWEETPELAQKRFRKRVLFEKLEQSGGRLDEWVNEEEELRVIDLLPDAKSLHPYDKIIDEIALEKIKKENAHIFNRLLEIFKKEEEGIPLSPKERQYKHRAIEKLKNKLII